jgi:uncharacterized protein YueI
MIIKEKRLYLNIMKEKIHLSMMTNEKKKEKIQVLMIELNMNRIVSLSLLLSFNHQFDSQHSYILEW